MSSIDFDSVTETAAALFEQALERGPGSEEFYRAWDKGLGDVRHRYPGTLAAVIAFKRRLGARTWNALKSRD